MPEDMGEKTEDATPKRLHDAREEGNVAKSMDAASALLLIGVTLTLWFALLPTLGGMKVMMEHLLGGDGPASLISVEQSGGLLRESLEWFVRLGAPILLVAWIIAYISHFWQIGWLFSTKQVQPKLSKLNPIKGFQRIFGLNAIVKSGIDSFKVALVVLVAVISIWLDAEEIIALPQLDLMPALGRIGWMLFMLALRVLAVLLLLGIIDLAYQRWKHRRDLRMSKTEVKQEMKETEGDPEVRKRRMRMQQQLSMQRIGAAVPKADVIITNPEHISIAIAYDEHADQAPKVIAKGQDHLAFRIRQIALQHGIPIVERKPLARALYKQVDVGQEIPPDFYQAVAEILAYVFRLSGKRAG